MWKDSVKQKLEHRLAAYGQGQLLRFWDELDHTQRQSLAAQIHGLDLELLDRLFQNRDMEGDIRALASRAGSPPGVRLSPETGTVFSNPPPQVARQAGREALAAGEIAAILVAGGQGTRLGFGYPKAMFPIGPVSRNSLLQILIEKVLAVSRRFGVRVPLGIMTSPATDGPIRLFLAEHGRFGLPEDDVLFFCQGTMPAVDARTGKVLLVARDRVALSPDGHGGLLAAVARSGALDELAQRGIRTLFYFQVDNPLVQFGSAEFIGYHRLAGSELSTQVIAKQSPMERVGNVVEVDGRLRVIDYKTAGPTAFTRAALERGEKLQLPLYALAARDALGLGEPVDGFYWHVPAAKPSAARLARCDGGAEGAMERAARVAAEVATEVVAGRFAPRPPAEGCPSYCAAASFCWHYRARRG